jgi:coproporphyrinogen III oxidase-like Fe-S oxidoreductase
LMLGLRLTSGIDLKHYARRFGNVALDERAAAIDALTDRGLLERVGHRLRLTPRATMLANDVCSQVL